jgi:hypothetical protein
MPRYFAIDGSGNIRQADTPAPVVTNEVVGAANGVDLTIRGAVGQPGTYSYGGNVTIVGGLPNSTSAYQYGGSVTIAGATNSAGIGGDVTLNGGGGNYTGGIVSLNAGYGSSNPGKIFLPLLQTGTTDTGALFNNSGTVGQPGTVGIA